MNFLLILRQHWLFCVLIAFCVLFCILSFDGYYFYDDTTYAFYAYQFSKGTYQISTNDIFAHRWGLIFPLALLYKIFGVNDFANVALPLLATLMSFSLFWVWVKKLFPSPQKEIAFALFALDFYTLFFANKLYPDVLLTTLVLGAIFLLWNRKNNFWQAFFFIFLNFWGFLCKETIFFIAPFYICVCVYDLFKKQNIRFWIMVFITAIAIVTFYLGLYAYFTKNPFFRFSLIQQGHTDYTQFRSEGFLFERLTYAPLLMFVNTSLIIAFAGALTKVFVLSKKLQHFSNFTLGAFAISLLAFWLMPVDFEHYTPIYLLPRHILFLVPLGAVVSAEAIQQKPFNIFTAMLMFFSAGIAWHTLGIKVAGLYVCVGVWILFFSKFKKENFGRLGGLSKLKILSLLAILVLHPIYTMLKPTETGYKYEKMLFKQHLNLFQKPCVVLTDDKLISGHKWYFQFEVPQGVVFKHFEDLNKVKQIPLPQYIILNEYSIAYFEQIGKKFPEWVYNIPANWRKIASYDRVSLYEIPAQN